MVDPLFLIFYPGGIAMAAIVVSPLAFVAHSWWRRRALRRNTDSRCGHCNGRLGVELPFLFSGVYICAACASALRRRLRWVFPALVAGAAVFAITSATGFIASVAGGNVDWGWWLDGRWVALLAPSVGVLGMTALAVAVSKRYNALRSAADAKALEAARTERTIELSGRAAAEPQLTSTVTTPLP